MLGQVEHGDYIYELRKITPIETWRLMGFTDEDFHKAEAVNSNSRLYMQAGNSIVKNVLMEIFRPMLDQKPKDFRSRVLSILNINDK